MLFGLVGVVPKRLWAEVVARCIDVERSARRVAIALPTLPRGAPAPSPSSWGMGMLEAGVYACGIMLIRRMAASSRAASAS